MSTNPMRGSGEQAADLHTVAGESAATGDAQAAHRSLRDVLSGICWFFTGLGVYRAWIETCFVGQFVSFPVGADYRLVFDLSCMATLVTLVILSKRLTPLLSRAWPRLVAGVGMTASGLLMFATIAWPGIATALAMPAALLGGVAIALMILLWSELYGCLNPIRIALYYSLSQLVGAAVIWTLKGFAQPWLVIYACLLPAVSLAMLRRALDTLPPERRPLANHSKFSFPWKPAAFVSVYAFAFGMREAATYSFTGPHSGLGMVAVALTVVVAILFLSRWVDFGTVYSAWLPALMLVSLLISLIGPIGPLAGGFFISLSYGAAEIFMMVMIGSLVYRYGASGVWLFGIERAFRMAAMALGRATEPLAQGSPLVIAVIVLAVLAFMLIVSERGTTSKWGIELIDNAPLTQAARQNILGSRCAELGRAHGLTEREEEVLLSLAQHKEATDI